MSIQKLFEASILNRHLVHYVISLPLINREVLNILLIKEKDGNLEGAALTNYCLQMIFDLKNEDGFLYMKISCLLGLRSFLRL